MMANNFAITISYTSMSTKTENFTQRELLIRIDERQKQMSEDIASLKACVEGKVSLDGDYEDIKDKVGKLWDWKNRTIGYAAGAGALASLVFEVIKTFV